MYLVNKILHLVTVHQINANILNDTKHSTINHTDKVMLKHRNELVLHQIKSNKNNYSFSVKTDVRPKGKLFCVYFCLTRKCLSMEIKFLHKIK